MDSDKVLPGVLNITVPAFFPSYPDQLRPLTLSPQSYGPIDALLKDTPT